MSQPPSGSSSKTGSTVLAQLIRDRRHQLGMTRQELAEATGVPYSTIAQIETAYRGVSPSRLGVIARTLQLDPAELYDVLAREPTPAPAAAPPATAPTPRESWHSNPAYVTAMRQPPAPDPEVVTRVVGLLSQLPAARRLQALGEVQARVMADLVQDEVQRLRQARD